MSELRSPGRLAGKVAIVTGAAPRSDGVGNGSAVAILFAREGATVVLVNRSSERARSLQGHIDAEGGISSIYAADVTQEEEVQALIADTIERYGRIDVVHNNVGIGGKSRVDSMTAREWDRVMDTNVKSIVWMCKHSIPHMRSARGGSVINVSSIAGAVGLRDPVVGLVAYSAAKAAVIGLSRSLAAEHAGDAIRVNCIIVGMVDTPMVGALPPESLERRRLSVPLKNAGAGWDVGWAAVYLASDESRWVTGAEIPVDGGYMRLFTRPR